MTEQNREQALEQIIDELFQIAAPGYLKRQLWRAYLTILSERGQKATKSELNKSVLDPIAPQVQQILMDIAKAYQADREQAKGYENTESVIADALFPLAEPGAIKNSLYARYQELLLAADLAAIEAETGDPLIINLGAESLATAEPIEREQEA